MRHRRSLSVVCAVVVCLSAALRAQATSPSSPIQVVYVLSGSGTVGSEARPILKRQVRLRSA